MVQRSRAHVWIGIGFVGIAIAIAGAIYLGMRLSSGGEAQAAPPISSEAAGSLEQQQATQAGEQTPSADEYARDSGLPGPNQRVGPAGGESYRTLLDAERTAREAQDAANAAEVEAADAAGAAAAAQRDAARSDKTAE